MHKEKGSTLNEVVASRRRSNPTQSLRGIYPEAISMRSPRPPRRTRDASRIATSSH